MFIKSGPGLIHLNAKYLNSLYLQIRSFKLYYKNVL